MQAYQETYRTYTLKAKQYGKQIDSLVKEINKQEEVKEEMVNLDNDIQLLKQAMSDLHDNVQKVEKAAKDGTDMVKVLNAAKDSMDTAVSAFCRVVTRAGSTVLKVEMTDECLNTIKSARKELIKAEIALLANHRRMLLQEYRNQNEELLSLLKSGEGGGYICHPKYCGGGQVSHMPHSFIVFGLDLIQI